MAVGYDLRSSVQGAMIFTALHRAEGGNTLRCMMGRSMCIVEPVGVWIIVDQGHTLMMLSQLDAAFPQRTPEPPEWYHIGR